MVSNKQVNKMTVDGLDLVFINADGTEAPSEFTM
jgi:alkyl sulfatase BDS1-like metallo-beta-lactamase superfamily hydrolase